MSTVTSEVQGRGAIAGSLVDPVCDMAGRILVRWLFRRAHLKQISNAVNMTVSSGIVQACFAIATTGFVTSIAAFDDIVTLRRPQSC
mmetsp:Transcript_22289/g.53002  ORF Transcript_22289/g.53002 Transcript_22289/m.53002 type:complete len:87 (-) Transcript_22289:1108-1368(-)